MFNLLPALITGGASLLSGLANPKKDNRKHNLAVAKGNMKRLEKTNKREIRWNRQVEAKAKKAGSFMMAEAERLGINPITYLNAGGLSHAFNVATVGLAKPAFQTHIRPEEAYHSTGMTTGQAFGGALEAFAGSAAATIQQESQNAFEREMLGLRLAAANSRGTGSGYSVGGVPTARIFSDSGMPHISSTPGRGGAALTFHGSLYDMSPQLDPEKGKAAVGELAWPFVEMGAKLEPFFKEPENVDTMTKIFRSVDRHAGEGLWWLVEESLRTFEASNKRREQAVIDARNRYARESIEAGKRAEDNIFNPGFW